MYIAKEYHNIKQHFREPNQGDIHFPKRFKDIPTFENLNNLNIKLFGLTTSPISLPLKYINRNCYEKQKDLSLCEKNYC